MHTGIIRLALLVLLLVHSYPAAAQQAKRVPLIGYFSPESPATESRRAEGILLALRERGYFEGQSIVVEYRYAEGKADRYGALATELVRRNADIIVVAGGAGPVRAAKNTTKTIPIVMTGSGIDPVEACLVASLAHPGGNVTGLTLLSTELGGKRLELLKEAVGRLSRVAVLYDPATAGATREVKDDLPAAARALKLTVQSSEIRDNNNLENIFTALLKQRSDGVYATGGGLVRANVKRITEFALKNRLPSVYSNEEAVEAGGLMSYAADDAESYRRVAYYVDRILKGTKPADLPVEQPTKFEFVINLKTAKQIGVNIAPEVLARATRLIR